MQLAHLGANLVGDLFEGLADSFDRTSGLEDDSATRASLVLKLGFGAPVDVADSVIERFFEILAVLELVLREGDALGVLARDVHAGKSRAASDGQGGRHTAAVRGAMGTVGGDRRRLLAPGGRGGSGRTRLA